MSPLEKMINDRKAFILSVFGLIPDDALSPVQTQKLFFLLEKRLNLNYFNFKPYHYGPYDKGLTDTLLTLHLSGLIQIKSINGITHYQMNKNITPETSSTLNEEQKKFILDLIMFIKKLSFKELCMSIYREFPEMSANGVFFGKKI